MASPIRTVANGEEALPIVLIVDESADFVNGLAAYLENYGFTAQKATSWTGMVECLNDAKVNIILLEQRVGQVDTVARLGEIQALTAAPIIFLSNNQSEADRILALELGAADFLLKPMSGREIVARIRAHLRRVAVSSTQAVATQPSWRLVGIEHRLYTPDGTTVPLTGTEFSVLEHLAKAAGQPVRREELTQQVLQRPYQPDDRSIDNLIYQLRQKISAAGGGEVIIAMRGQGYAFTGFEQMPSASDQPAVTKVSTAIQVQNDS